MASPYKIKISGAGVSTDLFNVLYNTLADSTFVLAANPCGITAINLTQAQLLAGFTVMLPSNAKEISIIDANGVCSGKSYKITLT